MGLDSFWVHPDDNDDNQSFHPEFSPCLNLTGGLFSGHGVGSFRGKVYDPFIHAITEVGLYQDVISNDVICQMADDLEAFDVKDSNINEQYGIYEHEVADLQRMFRAYADAGFELHGWW